MAPTGIQLDPGVDALIEGAARQYDVDPNLMRAVTWQESGGNPQVADSTAGAKGVAQFLPATLREVMGPNADPYDLPTAIAGEAKYLAQGMSKGEQAGIADPAAYAVSYYHGGPDTAQWGPKTAAYLAAVTSHYQALSPVQTDSGDAPAAIPSPNPSPIPNPLMAVRGGLNLPAVPQNAGLPLASDLRPLAAVGVLSPAEAAAALPPVQLAAAGTGDWQPGGGTLMPGGALLRPPPAAGAADGAALMAPDLAALRNLGLPPAGAGSGATAGAPVAAGASNAAAIASGPSAGAAAAAPPDISKMSDDDLVAAIAGGQIRWGAPSIGAAGVAPPGGAAALPGGAAGAGAAPSAAVLPGMRTPPPGVTPTADLNGLLRGAGAAERSGLPDMAANYRSTYQTIVGSGLMPYSNGQLYPIAGGPRDPTMIGSQAGAEASARAAATAPFETVEATVQTPQGAVKMQVPRNIYNAAIAAQFGAPGGGSGGGAVAPVGNASGTGGAGGVGSGNAMGGLQLTGTPVPPPGYAEGISKLAANDADQLTQARSQVADGQKDLANIAAIQDLLPRVSTGWGTNTINEGAMLLRRLGLSDEAIRGFTGIDPSAAGDLTKKFLELSAGAVRQMGAREPGSVISLFSRAYPSLESTPQTILFQTNALMQDRLRQQDYANAMEQTYTQGMNAYRRGGDYQGLTGLQAQFNKDHPASAYLHGAEAMSGMQQAWANATPDQTQQIQAQIPVGSRYLWTDGSWKLKGG